MKIRNVAVKKLNVSKFVAKFFLKDLDYFGSPLISFVEYFTN